MCEVVGYRVAAGRVGVSVRTVKRWHSQGLRGVSSSAGVAFSLSDLWAWRRYKLLVNPAVGAKRERLQRVGAAPALTGEQVAEIVAAYVRAGGRV